MSIQEVYNSWLGGPASIDWCEPNYIVNPYVAEFWNFVSSLIMAAIPAYGLWWMWRQQREWRFLLLDVAVIVIGLGSALFHGTLTFWGQLADELPMLYGAFIWIYVVLHLQRRENDYIYIGLLVALGLSWSILGRFIHKTHNVIFEIVFGLLVFFALALISKMVMRSPNAWARRLLKWYVVLASVSFLVWNLDQWFCKSLTPFYLAYPYGSSLHGFWHVGMGLNTYVGILMALLLRHEFLHGPATMGGFILPVLNAPKEKK